MCPNRLSKGLHGVAGVIRVTDQIRRRPMGSCATVPPSPTTKACGLKPRCWRAAEARKVLCSVNEGARDMSRDIIEENELLSRWEQSSVAAHSTASVGCRPQRQAGQEAAGAMQVVASRPWRQFPPRSPVVHELRPSPPNAWINRASRKRDLRTRGLMAARRCLFDCLGASPSAHSKGLPPKTTDEIPEGGNFVAFRVPENPLSVCTPRSRRRAGSSALLPKRKAPDHERDHSRNRHPQHRPHRPQPTAGASSTQRGTHGWHEHPPATP